ncbi:YitT family protein [Ammoniphilus sp. YIM 78166]|uniref:YczE/YyaS/YitT family protein n=1 Tax=Ammoniphilus sp. YIM 78166 TaxID=1644106 RepID=UPI00106F6640|nr:YitT family protein [Ammoniphilus sp. YIM 78166]
MKRQSFDKTLFVRYFMFFLGLVVIAFGSVLTIRSNLGVAPWESFHIGLYYTFGLTIGIWTQIVGAIVIILSFLIAKIKPNLGTVLNIVFFGAFIDLFLWLDIVPEWKTIGKQCLFFLLGLLIIGIGFGMYISPRLGAGPRDSLMLAINEKWGWSIQRSRITIEVAVLLAGWLMGGPVSIGTFLIAILLGPLIQWSIPFWEKRMAKSFGRVPKEPIVVNGS